MTATTNISGCILVKNEASLLPRCIQSLRAFVQEIVVIDNGSIDNTHAIAEQYNCKVVSLPEANHDEGRNQYLRIATEPWILVLDADERITHQGGMSICNAVASAPHFTAGFNLPRFEYIGNGKWATIRILRLFRNHPQIHYSAHKIHSTPASSVLTLGSVEHLHVPIHHIDILIKDRTSKKRERNIQRLLNELENDDKSPRLHYFLGLEYTSIGFFDKAEKEYRRAIELYEKGSPRAVLYLAHLYVLQNRLPEAEYLASSIPLYTSTGEQAGILLAEIAYRYGNKNRAIGICEQLLAHNPLRSHVHINLAALQQEDQPKEALHHLKQAIELNPYLIKAIIYRQGDIPNIFQSLTSFLSCTKTIYEHMVDCLNRLGERRKAEQWNESYKLLRQTITYADTADQYSSFAPSV